MHADNVTEVVMSRAYSFLQKYLLNSAAYHGLPLVS